MNSKSKQTIQKFMPIFSIKTNHKPVRSSLFLKVRPKSFRLDTHYHQWNHLTSGGPHYSSQPLGTRFFSSPSSSIERITVFNWALLFLGTWHCFFGVNRRIAIVREIIYFVICYEKNSTVRTILSCWRDWASSVWLFRIKRKNKKNKFDKEHTSEYK